MSCYIDVVGCTNNDDHNGIDKGGCPYCRITELEQQLKQARRQGWELAKAEARVLSFSCSCNKAIAAMEYEVNRNES